MGNFDDLIPSQPSTTVNNFADLIPSSPSSNVNRAAEFASTLATKGITLPLTNPISSGLESAGEKVNKAIQDVAGRVAEKGLPMTATAMSMIGEGGKLTPSNLAVGVGTEAINPLGANALWKGQTLKPKLNEIIKGLLDDFAAKQGRSATPEEIGQIIKQGFEQGYAPKEAQVTAQNAEIAKVPGKIADFQTQRMGGEPLSQPETGQSVQKDIANELNSRHENSNTLYEKLGERMGDQKASRISDGMDFIDKVFGQRGINYNQSQENIQRMFRELGAKDLTEKYTPQQLLEMQNTLSQARAGQFSTELDSTKKAAYTKMVQVMNDLYNPDLTAKQLSQVRTDVGRYAYSGLDDPIKSVYKGLYGALTNDLNRTAEEGGFSTLSTGARSYYKQLKDFEESDIVKASQSKDPSQILNWAVKTPERAGRLMESLSPQSQSDVQNGLLNRIHENATDKATGLIDPKDVTREINKIPDETLKAVYGDKFFTIDAYRKYSDSLSKSDTFSEPPDAKTARMMRLLENSQVIGKIMSDGTVENLRNTLNNLPDIGKEALKRGVFDQILRDSLDNQNQLDLGKFASNVQSFEKDSPGWLKTLYESEDYKTISALKRVADYSDSNLDKPFVSNLARSAIYMNPMMKAYMFGKAVAGGIIPRMKAPGDIATILGQEGASNLAPELFNQKLSPKAMDVLKTMMKQGLIRLPFRNSQNQ